MKITKITMLKHHANRQNPFRKWFSCMIFKNYVLLLGINADVNGFLHLQIRLHLNEWDCYEVSPSTESGVKGQNRDVISCVLLHV